ncbi:hypothetical protein D7252_08870 [Microbacterium sp. CGR2]|nr:hypothetical protein D7252_08870 [Microbacterium sp. CGR2]
MAVKERMGYAIECDFPDCGTSTQDLGDYAFWGSLEDAVQEWVDHDGYADDLGYYCHGHTVWNDSEEEGIEERVPMPYSIDTLFDLAERRIASKIDYLTRNALYNHGNRVRDLASRQAARYARASREVKIRMVQR